jgi:hypothetical protein
VDVKDCGCEGSACAIRNGNDFNVYKIFTLNSPYEEVGHMGGGLPSAGRRQKFTVTSFSPIDINLKSHKEIESFHH